MGRLADQLCVDANALAGYGEREQTRTDHLRLVLQYSGWRLPRALEIKELEEFLLARAMEHDSPSLLFRLACEHLRTSQVVRPGVVTLIERVAAARARAERETYDRLAHLLTDAPLGSETSTVMPRPGSTRAPSRRGDPGAQR